MKKLKVTVYRDNGGDYRWRVQSSNGKIMADSGEGYGRKRDCLAALRSMAKRIVAGKIVLL